MIDCLTKGKPKCCSRTQGKLKTDDMIVPNMKAGVNLQIFMQREEQLGHVHT